MSKFKRLDDPEMAMTESKELSPIEGEFKKALLELAEIFKDYTVDEEK